MGIQTLSIQWWSCVGSRTRFCVADALLPVSWIQVGRMHIGDPPLSRRRDSASPVGCDWQRLVVENAPDVFSTHPNRFQTVRHLCDHIERNDLPAAANAQRRVAPAACQESDDDWHEKSQANFFTFASRSMWAMATAAASAAALPVFFATDFLVDVSRHQRFICT